MMKAERTDILAWIDKNRTESISDNRYISQTEALEFLSDLAEIEHAVNTAADDAAMRDAVLRGNDLFKKVNETINHNRYKQEGLSLDTFKKICDGKQYYGRVPLFTAINSTFDLIFDCEDYKLASDFIKQIRLDPESPQKIPMYVLMSSNPINPLFRKIPTLDQIGEFMADRYALYEAALKFYEPLGGEYLSEVERRRPDKPEDYHKVLAEYDQLKRM